MKPTEPLGAVRVINQTRDPARLRFRCNDALAWEVWLSPGGGVQVPDPLRGTISVRASILDDVLGTEFFAARELYSRGAHLLANMGMRGNALLFALDEKPHGLAGELVMGNETRFELRLSLRLLNTPFELVHVVPAAATQVLRLDAFDFGVTMNGISTRIQSLCPWQGEYLISSASPQFPHQQEPRLVVTRSNTV